MDDELRHIPQPIRKDGAGATDLGPRDVLRDIENPDMLVPPKTDAGTIPNLKFSFSDTHMHLNHRRLVEGNYKAGAACFNNDCRCQHAAHTRRCS